MKRRWVVLSTILAAAFGALSVPAIASSGVGAYLFPPLAVVCLVPMLLRLAPKRWVYSGIALAVLVWTLAASTVRPRLLQNGGSAAFILMGVLLTFSAVLLVSQNQEVVTAPLRPLIDRASRDTGGCPFRDLHILVRALECHREVIEGGKQIA